MGHVFLNERYSKIRALKNVIYPKLLQVCLFFHCVHHRTKLRVFLVKIITSARQQVLRKQRPHFIQHAINTWLY